MAVSEICPRRLCVQTTWVHCPLDGRSDTRPQEGATTWIITTERPSSQIHDSPPTSTSYSNSGTREYELLIKSGCSEHLGRPVWHLFVCVPEGVPNLVAQTRLLPKRSYLVCVSSVLGGALLAFLLCQVTAQSPTSCCSLFVALSLQESAKFA